jgi:hypothetical protein
MAFDRVALQSSQAQTASSNGSKHSVANYTMAVAYVDVTAVSGTTPQASFWLQGSNDDGTTWFDLLHDGALPTADSTQADQTAAAAGKRNINGGTVVSATGKFAAVYKHLPCKHVRLRWNISGTTPSFTFSATLDVK